MLWNLVVVVLLWSKIQSIKTFLYSSFVKIGPNLPPGYYKTEPTEMINLSLCLTGKTWGAWSIYKNRSDSFCFTYCVGLKTNQNIFQSMPAKPHCLRLMCIKLFCDSKKKMTHLCLTFYFPHLWTCAEKLLDLLLSQHHFFLCLCRAAWSAVCFWWNECLTNQYKPRHGSSN